MVYIDLEGYQALPTFIRGEEETEKMREFVQKRREEETKEIKKYVRKPEAKDPTEEHITIEATGEDAIRAAKIHKGQLVVESRDHWRKRMCRKGLECPREKWVEFGAEELGEKELSKTGIAGYVSGWLAALTGEIEGKKIPSWQRRALRTKKAEHLYYTVLAATLVRAIYAGAKEALAVEAVAEVTPEVGAVARAGRRAKTIEAELTAAETTSTEAALPRRYDRKLCLS